MNRIRAGLLLLAMTPIVTTAYATGSGLSFTNPNSVAIQPDGKIVVAGHLEYDGHAFAVARFDADGDRDPGFGGDGGVTTSFGSPPQFVAGAAAVAIASDGKIVAAGSVALRVAVAVYNSDGSPDAAFGVDGAVVTDLSPVVEDEASDVAIQSDGKIVVVGHSGNDLFMMRYTTAGALDTDFDSDGILTLPGVIGSYNVPRVKLQANGRILLASGINGIGGDVMLRRYEADGQLDTTFSDDGIVLLPDHISVESLVLQGDGKILLATLDGTIARYTADGVLDSGFDGDGVVSPTALDYLAAIVLQNDGKIVAIGHVGGGPFTPLAGLVRYLPDGSIDTGFGNAGVVPTVQAPSTEIAIAAAVQPDGAFVTTGILDDFSTGFVRRYDSDGNVDSGFAEDGLLVESICRYVPPTSPSCIGAASASARICRMPRLYGTFKTRTSWQWHGTESAAAATSGNDSAYSLCVYDTRSSAPRFVRELKTGWAGWRETSHGWKFRDTNRYVKARISTPDAPRRPAAGFMAASGPSRFSDTRFFENDAGVIVQLVNSDGVCLQSTFAGDEIRQNDGKCFDARK